MRAQESGGFLQVIGVLLAVAASSGQTASVRLDQQSEKAILSDSEISYSESGGFAGRTRETRLIASRGVVTAEFRPAGSASTTPMLTTSVERDQYLALWEEAERIGIWTLVSPKKTPGADLVESELRVRLGLKSRVIRWNDGGGTALRDAGLLGQRIFGAAQRATSER